jgi:hypothetical protein
MFVVWWLSVAASQDVPTTPTDIPVANSFGTQAPGDVDLDEQLHHYLDDGSDPTLPCEYEDQADHMHFEEAVHGWSNLNGLGPDSGVPITFRIFGVGTSKNGVQIDLDVSASRDFRSNAPQLTRHHGLAGGGLASINKEAPHTAGSPPTSHELTFTFLNNDTSAEYVMDRFMVLFYGFDAGAADHNGVLQARKCATFDNSLLDFHVSETTQINVEEASDKATKFCATESGQSSDDPSDPHALTPRQIDRTLGVRYVNRSSFVVTPSIDCCVATGRSFVFSLDRKEAVACPTQASPQASPRRF